MPSGNPNLPQVGEKGLEMEFLASNYLRERGYQIIHGGVIIRMRGQQKKWEHVEPLRRKLGIVTRANFTIYDYLCKKGKQYFLFEIKYKIGKEGRPNFNSSERQIWQYNRIQKLGRVQVKVLTIIEKDQKLSYHIYNWNDFEKTKTTIKLKDRESIFSFLV